MEINVGSRLAQHKIGAIFKVKWYRRSHVGFADILPHMEAFNGSKEYSIGNDAQQVTNQTCPGYPVLCKDGTVRGSCQIIGLVPSEAKSSCQVEMAVKGYDVPSCSSSLLFKRRSIPGLPSTYQVTS